MLQSQEKVLIILSFLLLSACGQEFLTNDFQSKIVQSGTEVSSAENSDGQVQKLERAIISSTQYLISSFNTPAIIVNSRYQNLPKNWSQYLLDPPRGGAGIVTPDSPYGGSARASSKAMYAIPPTQASDFIKVIFPLNLSRSTAWYLNFKVGILNQMTTGGPIDLQVVVSGDAIVTGEKPWQVLWSGKMSSGSSQIVSVPLALWPLRSNFQVALQAGKATAASGQPMLVIDELNVSSGTARPELGMDRSGLVVASEGERSSVISGSAQLGSRWFRDGFAFSPSPREYVDIVRKVKQNGMKMLTVILPSPVDFDSANPYVNAGDVFRNLCGHPYGALPLSRINLEKFKTRLQIHFDAVRAAGLKVDAFEVGNELDWTCFNADVPFGRQASAADLTSIITAYAQFLKTAVEVIRNPRYFPTAKIITFGLGNLPSSFAPGYHLEDPAALVARLRNLGGVNYLQSVSGYGVHIYPDARNAANEGRQVLNKNLRSLKDKALWITEWGFGTYQFPNSADVSRAQAMDQFLGMINSLYFTKLGPAFFYAYSSPGEPFGLVNAQGNLLPESAVFSSRYRF